MKLQPKVLCDLIEYLTPRKFKSASFDEELYQQLSNVCSQYQDLPNAKYKVNLDFHLVDNGKPYKRNSEIRVKLLKQNFRGDLEMIDTFHLPVYVNNKPVFKTLEEYLESFIKELTSYYQDVDSYFIERVLAIQKS